MAKNSIFWHKKLHQIQVVQNLAKRPLLPFFGVQLGCPCKNPATVYFFLFFRYFQGRYLTEYLAYHFLPFPYYLYLLSLANIQKVGPISFCRRRLPVVMKRNGMVERLETAIKFVEQGDFLLFFFCF